MSYSIVFFGDYWDVQWRRRQQLAWRLAKRDEVEHVLYVESPLTLISGVKFLLGKGDHDARARWQRVLRDRSFSFSPGKGITVLTPLTVLPQSGLAPLFAAEMLLRKALLCITVLHSMKRLGMKAPVVWTSLPTMARWIPKDRKLLWYDCTEDFSQWTWPPRTVIEHIRKTDAWLTQTAQILSAVSRTLVRVKEGKGKEVQYLPNGVDTAVFFAPTAHLPVEFNDIPRPRFTFIGMVNKRHDWNLLMHVATSRPAWHFVLLGNVSLDVEQRRKIDVFSNIHLLGARRYEELPGYLNNSDACVQFYSAEEGNDTCDGQKLYLYLASGKPIISTPPAVAPQIKDLITIVTDHDSMVVALERSLEDGSQQPARERKEAAALADWEVRVDLIIEQLSRAI